MLYFVSFFVSISLTIAATITLPLLLFFIVLLSYPFLLRPKNSDQASIRNVMVLFAITFLVSLISIAIGLRGDNLFFFSITRFISLLPNLIGIMVLQHLSSWKEKGNEMEDVEHADDLLYKQADQADQI